MKKSEIAKAKYKVRGFENNAINFALLIDAVLAILELFDKFFFSKQGKPLKMPMNMKWWHIWKYPKLFKAVKRAWNEIYDAFEDIVKKIRAIKGTP